VVSGIKSVGFAAFILVAGRFVFYVVKINTAISLRYSSEHDSQLINPLASVSGGAGVAATSQVWHVGMECSQMPANEVVSDNLPGVPELLPFKAHDTRLKHPQDIK
jgi:hypothetical protein